MAGSPTYVPSQIADIPALAAAFRADGGYSVISANGNNLSGVGSVPGTAQCITTRWRFVATASAHSIRALYGNWQTGGDGGYPNTNPISVKASIEAATAGAPNTQTNPREPFVFYGQRWGSIDPNVGSVPSDPNPLSVIAGQTYYIRTAYMYGANGTPPPAAPASGPTLSTGTSPAGSFPASTTYYLVITFTGQYGETLISPQASVTTGGSGSNSITVTAPGAQAGSTGYKIYIGTASGGPYYLAAPLGIIPLTSSAVLT